jgi:hypothetical protein
MQRRTSEFICVAYTDEESRLINHGAWCPEEVKLNSTPTRKVGAGALAGAFSVILVWVVGAFAGVTVPAEVAAAQTVIFTFVVSWLVSDA